LVGRTWTVEAAVAEALRDRVFYASSGGGVTLSGGEPLHQPDFALAVARACRAAGLHLALDTCGAVPGEAFEEALGAVDLVLFDLKLLDPGAHQRLLGLPLELVLSNLERVARRALPVWVRTPIIPGHTDTEENLRAIARHLRANLPALQRFDLLAFSNLCAGKYEMLGLRFPLLGVPRLPRSALQRAERWVREEGVDCVRLSGPVADG
jgi:pyruvate formate lyase activating enzyme